MERLKKEGGPSFFSLYDLTYLMTGAPAAILDYEVT
jgi:hypothetical protein